MNNWEKFYWSHNGEIFCRHDVNRIYDEECGGYKMKRWLENIIIFFALILTCFSFLYMLFIEFLITKFSDVFITSNKSRREP